MQRIYKYPKTYHLEGSRLQFSQKTQAKIPFKAMPTASFETVRESFRAIASCHMVFLRSPEEDKIPEITKIEELQTFVGSKKKKVS